MTMKDTNGIHVMMTGGGSGGHVFPALAVAAVVRDRGGRVSFVGSDVGLESRLVPEHGIAFYSLPARPFVGQGLWHRLTSLIVLAWSAIRAWRLVRRLAPGVVLGTGGYVSVSPVLGARLSRRPIVLLEPNAVPGAANRLLSRWTKGACVGWEGAGEALRCPSWVTGVPVRSEFFEVADLQPEEPRQLLIVGGSQGAQQLNRLLPAALELARERLGPIVVRHQAGARHLEETEADYRQRDLGRIEVEVVGFIEAMPAAIAASHLVVSRAGAITCAELAAAGRPSVLVPLSLAEGHQDRNAAALEEAGAAWRLVGDRATPEGLAAALEELLLDPARLKAMGAAARGLARPDAAERIEERLREAAA